MLPPLQPRPLLRLPCLIGGGGGGVASDQRRCVAGATIDAVDCSHYCSGDYYDQRRQCRELCDVGDAQRPRLNCNLDRRQPRAAECFGTGLDVVVAAAVDADGG